MNKRAEDFVRDWALQNVGPGPMLSANESETAELKQQLVKAALNAGITRNMIRDLPDLSTLIVSVRSLINGHSFPHWPSRSRRGLANRCHD